MSICAMSVMRHSFGKSGYSAYGSSLSISRSSSQSLSKLYIAGGIHAPHKFLRPPVPVHIVAVAEPVASIAFRLFVPVASVSVDETGFLAVVELPVAEPVALVVRK